MYLYHTMEEEKMQAPSVQMKTPPTVKTDGGVFV